MEITTKNAKETYKFGQRFAADLVKKSTGSNVILLNGELGAGKTTFAQGFTYALGVSDRVTSPTFILIREYKPDNDKYNKLYHLDLYRLEGNIKKQTEELGLDEIINDKENILLVEWADKLNGYFPKEAVSLEFKLIDENTRKIIVQK